MSSMYKMFENRQKHLPTTALAPVVPGSIQHTALQLRQSFAITWLRVDTVILFDRSDSMSQKDAPGGVTRFEMACSELAKLQASCPGRIAIVQFNDDVGLMPGGVPDAPASGTDLARALSYLRNNQMDMPGMRVIVISDGEPNHEEDALRVATQFQNRIDVVYCGPESMPAGREFLRRLSAMSGGILVTAACASGLMDATLKLLTTSTAG